MSRQSDPPFHKPDSKELLFPPASFPNTPYPASHVEAHPPSLNTTTTVATALAQVPHSFPDRIHKGEESAARFISTKFQAHGYEVSHERTLANSGQHYDVTGALLHTDSSQPPVGVVNGNTLRSSGSSDFSPLPYPSIRADVLHRGTSNAHRVAAVAAYAGCLPISHRVLQTIHRHNASGDAPSVQLQGRVCEGGHAPVASRVTTPGPHSGSQARAIDSARGRRTELSVLPASHSQLDRHAPTPSSFERALVHSHPRYPTPPTTTTTMFASIGASTTPTTGLAIPHAKTARVGDAAENLPGYGGRHVPEHLQDREDEYALGSCSPREGNITGRGVYPHDAPQEAAIQSARPIAGLRGREHVHFDANGRRTSLCAPPTTWADGAIAASGSTPALPLHFPDPAATRSVIVESSSSQHTMGASAGAASSAQTPVQERVQIPTALARWHPSAAAEPPASTSAFASTAQSGPISSACTSSRRVGADTGFGPSGRADFVPPPPPLADSFQGEQRQQGFDRLTLPTPVPFGDVNPSSQPLPRRRSTQSNSALDRVASSSTSSVPASRRSSLASLSSAPPTSFLTAEAHLPDEADGGLPTDEAPKRGSSGPVRKKVHGCWMCVKFFDRPSTLKKHLLVHTGEKSYICHICSRRFGVASNLNRHVRRCKAKLGHSDPRVFLLPDSLNKPEFSSILEYRSSAPDASGLRHTGVIDRESSSFVPALILRPNLPSREPVSNRSIPAPNSFASGSAAPPGSPAMARSAYPPGDVERSLPSTSQHVSGNDIRRSTVQRANSVVQQSGAPFHGSPQSHVIYQVHDEQNPYSAHDSSGSMLETQTTRSALAERVDEGETRRKRTRRPPSPDQWIPPSLASFEFYPAPALVQPCPIPLPPVKPLYDEAGECVEERDSFASSMEAALPSLEDEGSDDDNELCEPTAGNVASIDLMHNSAPAGGVHPPSSCSASGANDENAPPALASGSMARTRSEKAAAKAARLRHRLHLYAPYHPAGWIGRLPGPGVVLGTAPSGSALFAHFPAPGGSEQRTGGGESSGSSPGVTGNMVGGDMTNWRFEMFVPPADSEDGHNENMLPTTR